MEISGTRAIVTGGGSGIGRIVVERLADRGADVAVVDRDREAAESVCADRAGCFPIVCDISDPDSVAAALTNISTRFETVEILVNNAGIMRSAPLVNITKRGAERPHDVSLWRKVIDVNLSGTFYVTRLVADLMLSKRTRGVIVNISSIAAKGNAGQTAYSAAKAGIEAMTVVWSKELGRFKIRCVAISPGFMDTAGARDAIEEELLSRWQEQVPLRRLGEADEVAQAVEHAIENEFLNGCVVSLNGGLRL